MEQPHTRACLARGSQATLGDLTTERVLNFAKARLTALSASGRRRIPRPVYGGSGGPGPPQAEAWQGALKTGKHGGIFSRQAVTLSVQPKSWVARKSVR